MNWTLWKTTGEHLRCTAAALHRHDRGAIAVEYGLIAALVVVAVIGALRHLGETLVTLPLGSVVAVLANVIS